METTRPQRRRGVDITPEAGSILALRGKAVLATDPDGEDVIELRGDAVEEYHLQPGPELLAAVAAIHTPEDVIHFVARYGLLFHAPELDEKAEWRIAGPLYILSEDLDAYFALASELRDLRRLYDLSQRAWYGDRHSIAALRHAYSEFLTDHYDIDLPIDRFEPAALVLRVFREIASTISAALEKYWGRFLISLGSVPPRYTLLPASPTLAGHAWLQAAAEVLQSVELRDCPACEAVFAVTDPRQIYCSSRCAGRTRARRFRATHAAK